MRDTRGLPFGPIDAGCCNAEARRRGGGARRFMDVGSAIVYAMPQRIDAVRSSLAALPGVEIHTETGDGRFIVTVEDVPGCPAGDTVMQLHRLDGVLFASMVYQYSDDAGG